MLVLQIFRGALLGGGGLALGNGVALSYGGNHKVLTYVAWYLLAALLLAAGVVFWVQIHRRKEESPASDPNLLLRAAKHVLVELESCRLQLGRALNDGHFWPPDRHRWLPASKFQELEEADGADLPVYGAVAALYNRLNDFNKDALDRSANEERAIGGVLTEKSTRLDTEDRKNLEDAIEQITDIEQTLRDSVE
jgi:hypothetical protein